MRKKKKTINVDHYYKIVRIGSILYVTLEVVGSRNSVVLYWPIDESKPESITFSPDSLAIK